MKSAHRPLACLLMVEGVLRRWKKRCPTANSIIKYSRHETNKALDGDSAMELVPNNYGKDEWWLLFDPVTE